MAMSDDTRSAYEPSADPLNSVLAQNWWAIAIRGVLAIIFGIIAFAFTGVTILSLVLVFAAYTLVDGIFAIVAAVRAARRHDRWGWLTFEGIVSILTAAIAVGLPGLTVLAFVLLIAAWAIVTGILELAAAFRLNIEHGRVWLALGGVASIVFGVLLFIAPVAGAVVLTWWLGAYAMVFGVTLLVLAFRLRARHMHHAPPAGAHAVT
jgi:uncharacterized membrane protein HdeD (DUF308 family)